MCLLFRVINESSPLICKSLLLLCITHQVTRVRRTTHTKSRSKCKSTFHRKNAKEITASKQVQAAVNFDYQTSQQQTLTKSRITNVIGFKRIRPPPEYTGHLNM